MGFQLLRLNTNRVTMFGVAIAGVYLDGSVTTFDVTAINDSAGATITGETFPIAFGYQAGTNGEFRALIDSAAVLTAGASYTVVVDLADGVDRIGHWEIPAVAKTRDGIAVP